MGVSRFGQLGKTDTLRDLRVLIADDDPISRVLVEITLSRAGYTLVTASNGDQAWEHILAHEGPLLALLDWHMPGADGLELCRRIRHLPPGRQTYAILLTGHKGPQAVVHGLEAGAHDYITKPFDRQELFARLRVGLRVLTLQHLLANRITELEAALANVKQLQGLLPICSYCKSIRTDKDYWQGVDQYIAAHSEVQFSHGICPTCYDSQIEPQLQALRRDVEARRIP